VSRGGTVETWRPPGSGESSSTGRKAFSEGDRETARRHRGQLRPLAEDLARRQVTFDDTLKPTLTKDQWKRYEQWRDEQRKQAAKAWKDRRRPA